MGFAGSSWCLGVFRVHSYKSTYNLLRGLGGLLSTVILRAISALNLQVVMGSDVEVGGEGCTTYGHHLRVLARSL